MLTWAGLRGGISIALALTLPNSPWRVELLVATYAVVIFTIVVQGLTMPRFVRLAYGVKSPTSTDYDRNNRVYWASPHGHEIGAKCRAADLVERRRQRACGRRGHGFF